MIERNFGPKRGIQPKLFPLATRIAAPLLLAAVAVATPGFLYGTSLYAVMTGMAYVGCVAIGMTFVTISGNIMSFCLAATTAACSLVFVATLARIGFAPAIVAALAFGAVLNGIQGLIVGGLRANPIIVTIAALSLVTGTFQILTDSHALYPTPGSGTELLATNAFGVPIEFIVFLAMLILAQIILSFTIFGRNLFLVGDSVAAAEAVGIASWRTTTGAFAWAGLFASVGGILLAARFAQGDITFAQGFDYSAVAAVLVGGTSMSGGRGSVMRTLVGILFITVVQVVLVLDGLDLQWQYFNLGAIVLAVIMIPTSQATVPPPPGVMVGRRLANPYLRPAVLFGVTLAVMAVIDGRQGSILSAVTAYSTLQTFATIGPVALGLGIGMIAGVFDLSVAGTFGMASCIAVITGETYPLLGIAVAVLAGAAAGVFQAIIITRVTRSSTGVTLGGLLLFIGIAYVLTAGRSIPYENMNVALALDAKIAGVFSIRSLATVLVFLIAAGVVGTTRVGRDLIAMGSDRRAAIIAGVNVPRFTIGIFAFSGSMAGLSGALLGYSLATAAPSGLSDVLVPSTAAAILGGVSLSAGVGRPLGIAMGMLTLAELRAGLNAFGVSAALQDIATGSILLAVAIADGTRTLRRVGEIFVGISARRATRTR
jgi:ribose/xylose/arabinose/galactoside ABC-type transport system permease subunit